jgi:hypothetical protein
MRAPGNKVWRFVYGIHRANGTCQFADRRGALRLRQNRCNQGLHQAESPANMRQCCNAQ